jgi:PKHD-type hydroxylase
MDAGGGEAAPVYNAAGVAVDPRMRRATTLLLERGPDTEWIFARLDELFAAAAALFATPVDAVFEPVQLVRYGPGDHFQMWHSDAGVDRTEARRISCSIELSEPAEYAGGRLEIAPWRMVPDRSPEQGHATLFPSRCLHRVTPVERGVRYALVAWTGLNAP